MDGCTVGSGVDAEGRAVVGDDDGSAEGLKEGRADTDGATVGVKVIEGAGDGFDVVGIEDGMLVVGTMVTVGPGDGVYVGVCGGGGVKERAAVAQSESEDAEQLRLGDLGSVAHKSAQERQHAPLARRRQAQRGKQRRAQRRRVALRSAQRRPRNAERRARNEECRSRGARAG